MSKMKNNLAKMDEALPQKYRHMEAIGENVQFNHDECGDTRSRLYVTRTARGYMYHCHNCAPKCSGFLPFSGVQSARQVQEALTTKAKPMLSIVPAEEFDLPSDCTMRLPREAQSWLYKYHLNTEEIEYADFCYSPTLDRLIMPVGMPEALVGKANATVERGELVAYVGRALDPNKKPKYLYCRQKGISHPFYHVRNKVNDSMVVVVEDIISAIKVGRVAESIAMLGSFIGKDLEEVLSFYDEIVLWFDQDKYHESYKYAKSLREQGLRVRLVCTTNDPKECNMAVIRSAVLGSV